MKKIFFAALIIVSANSFAADLTNVNKLAVKNFKYDFAEAQDSRWRQMKDIAEVTFTLNGKEMSALYDVSGKVMATIQSISLNDLPIRAKRAFAKGYKDYTVKEAIRYQGSEEGYLILAENDKQKIILLVAADDSVSLFDRVVKR